MLKVKLSQKANADILSIGKYTKEKWGISQRDFYLSKISTALNQIAKFPNIGKIRNEVSRDLHSYVFEKHIVFYLVKS